MKKSLALLLIFLFFMTSGVDSFNPVKAQHQGDIAINADGSITPSTAPILQSANLYSLTSDINGSITVNRSNIFLEGNKHTITVSSIFSSGILLNNTSSCTVANFYVSDGQFGINIYGNQNTIINNSISSVNNGIYSLNEPTGGIALSGTSNSIAQNNFQGNLVGINFFGGLPNLNCSNNLIVKNTFTDCSTALLFHDSSNNTFYHNNFYNNKNDVYDSGSGVYPKVVSINNWDNGYPSGGNYWSDYLTKYPNAKMIDSSGLGDTAYVVETQNEDRYPIINLNQFYNFQHTSAELSIISPISQLYIESIVPLTFTVDKPVSWMGYSLDGQNNVTLDGNITVTNLTNGLHSIIVYANGTFGKIGTSQTTNFTIVNPIVEQHQPFPTVPIVAVSIVTVLLVAGLLVYFKKHKHGLAKKP